MAKASVVIERIRFPKWISGVEHPFKVVRVYNSLVPMSGALMTEADVQSMIDQGVNVAIDPEGRKTTHTNEGGKSWT